MRILYGVTGCGLGHTMRARTMTRYLLSRGHSVRLAASGRAVAILRSHGLDVVPIDGMNMTFEDGAVRRWRTVRDLAKSAPSAIAHNTRVAFGDVLDFAPDLVVTDFDSFTHAIGMTLGIPIVSFDHQHVIDRFRHPEAALDRMSRASYRMARAVVAAKTPGCDAYIVTSFFFPEPRKATTLVGPVVRPEIENATPTDGDHVLVYQTTASDAFLVPALREVPGTRFVVYGLGRDERIGNVELRAFDERRFVDDLASSRAVISNGGFTAISEALHLGKPVLSVPVRGQPEQELNAAWLEVLGAGVSARRIDPVVVRRFLDRPFERVQDARIRAGSQQAFAAFDRILARAA